MGLKNFWKYVYGIEKLLKVRQRDWKTFESTSMGLKNLWKYVNCPCKALFRYRYPTWGISPIVLYEQISGGQSLPRNVSSARILIDSVAE